MKKTGSDRKSLKPIVTALALAGAVFGFVGFWLGSSHLLPTAYIDATKGDYSLASDLGINFILSAGGGAAGLVALIFIAAGLSAIPQLLKHRG